MSKLQKRATQTKVKHLILEEYLFKWGIIINEGISHLYKKISSLGQQFQMRYVYVDCNAYMGRYASENDSNEPVFGSPVIGIESLEKIAVHARNQVGFTPETFALLFEEQRKAYEGLLETLDLKGYGRHVKQTDEFFSLQNNDIAVIHADYKDYVDQLLRFTGQSYTWSFYSLDPYGAKAIPLSVVSKIISQSQNDVMINLPYNDLHRKSGPAARRDAGFEEHTGYFDEMYGDDSWRGIAKQYFAHTPEERKDKMESELVSHYVGTLQKKDPALAIKTIRLKYPAMERTMFYLLLTTHDPTGAITLNEILDQARLRQYELREEHRHVYKLKGQMNMFAEMNVEDLKAPTNQEPDLDDLADIIYKKCKGEGIEFREVLRRMTDLPYYLSAIRKAMTKLKRSKRAKYKKLDNRELIRFK